jgi:hypothetical protein
MLVVVLFSLLALAPVELFGFMRRALRRSVERSHARCNPVTGAQKRQPGRRVEAAIEELSAE